MLAGSLVGKKAFRMAPFGWNIHETLGQTGTCRQLKLSAGASSSPFKRKRIQREKKK